MTGSRSLHRQQIRLNGSVCQHLLRAFITRRTAATAHPYTATRESERPTVTDREPSTARSGHQCEATTKLAHLPRARTLCEPGTARGPVAGYGRAQVGP